MLLFAPYAAAYKQSASINFKSSTPISFDGYRAWNSSASVLPSSLAGDQIEAGWRKGDALL